MFKYLYIHQIKIRTKSYKLLKNYYFYEKFTYRRAKTMKKYLYLIALIMLTSCFMALAQDDSDEGGEILPARKSSQWGVKAGLNFTSFSDTVKSLPNLYTNRTGFLLGVFNRSDIMPLLSYQIEIVYSSVGSSFSDNQASISINYLNLGGLLKFYPLTNKIGANAGLGVQYGYLLGVNQNGLDIGTQYNSSNWDLIAGLGYDFDFGLNVDFRYTYGLMVAYNYKEFRSTNTERRNVGFQVQLGWGF